jgi:hypothetical protein
MVDFIAMDDRPSMEAVKKGVVAIFGLLILKLLLEKAWAIKRSLDVIS